MACISTSNEVGVSKCQPINTEDCDKSECEQLVQEDLSFIMNSLAYQYKSVKFSIVVFRTKIGKLVLVWR